MDKGENKIGFSQGTFYQFCSRFSDQILNFLEQEKINVFEIHIKSFQITKLEQYALKNKDRLEKIKYLSLHAPTDIIYKDDRRTLKLLSLLDKINKILNFNFIVFHPDVVKDKGLLKIFDLPVAIENMDQRKTTGKNVEQIKDFIFGTGFQVLIDLNHCLVNDPTLQLAQNFWDEFKEKVCGFHISGYEFLHEPLFQTKQDELISFVKNKDRPIIIESPIQSFAQAEKEYNYIKEIINKNGIPTTTK